MGEYAKFSGKQIKIGTCESMYYLRADQRRLVTAIPGNVNVNNGDALHVRFRFPWPDEDDVEPGAFENYRRAITAWGFSMPEGVNHGNIQFRADAGYLTLLPCPEGPGPHPVSVHRNGFGGAVRLVQQKLLADGRIVPVCECGGCGAAWRLEEPKEIEALARCFLEQGEQKRKDAWHERDGEKLFVGHEFWHKIANRILAGAGMPCLSDLQ